jgi:tetratricopeptide (TPR) repeat protein
MTQFNDCANNHFDNGNYDNALSCYTRALGIMPNYSWALCNRATVHLARDDVVRHPVPSLLMSCDYH